MLFKRGSTISAAEGGCQAEVGGTPSLLIRCMIDILMTRCAIKWHAPWPALDSRHAWEVSSLSVRPLTRSHWATASPETVLQAAEIGIGTSHENELVS